MRKIIVSSFITMDGVIQAPGGREEDPSGGFKYGGWQMSYRDDSIGKVISGQISRPFDLLLGRKTYEIFAPYWAKQTGEIADSFNKATKYIITHTNLTYGWAKTVVICEHVVEEIQKLKEEDAPDLHIYGSSNLIQTLLKNSLVDELWLKIYPITIGTGKRLFAEGTIPKSWKMIKGEVTPTGIIIADYRLSGEISSEFLSKNDIS